MPGFSCTQRIPFRGIDNGHLASLPCVMELMLEASMRHNEATPRPSAWYWENGEGFVLTNWQAVIDRYPRWNEEVVVRTWPVSHKGFVADRSFEMLDGNGESLARANSGWVYVDMARRRPARPAEGIISGYGEPMPYVMEKDFRMPKTPGPAETGVSGQPGGEFSAFSEAGSRIMAVTRRDLDANRHVNSVTYLDWAMDSLTAHGICPSGRVRSMKTAYRKECSLGARVEITAFADAAPPDAGGGSRAVVLTREADGERALLCEVYLTLDETWGAIVKSV